MKEIWKRWFGRKNVETIINEPKEKPVKTKEAMDARPQKNSLLDDLETCLFARYDFRFNVLTEHTEYAPKGSPTMSW